MKSMNNGILKKTAAQYGTPSFVFDEKALKERARQIQDIFGQGISLCYSIKANPFLIPAMLDVTDKLEVCSPGELDICRKLGVEPSCIVYSGVNKTQKDVGDAVSYNCGIYTAESLRHIAILQKEGERQGRVLKVIPRLNSGSQFGMSKSDLFTLLESRGKLPNIAIMGLHYFVGTQRRKIEHQKKDLEMLRSLYMEIANTFGFRLRKLEYGPGLPVPYFENEDFTDTLEPARQLAPLLREATGWCELTVEMGRFFTSECGYYLTKVCDIKSADGAKYCIIDGGMNHITYLGQMMGMKVPIIRKIDSDIVDEIERETAELFGAAGSGTESLEYTLCGSLCTTADVLVRQMPLQDLKIGDILAFCNIGAYSVTEGIYLFLSRTMPRILLVKEDGSVVVARDFVETSSFNC